MSEAATDWISPYWRNLWSPPVKDVYGGAQVWVMNPGVSPSKVTVSFYDAVGEGLVGTESETVPPLQCRIFGAVGEDRQGWCHVSSDHPVLPWGFTAVSTGDDTGYVSMSFHRADPELRKLIRAPIVPQQE